MSRETENLLRICDIFQNIQFLVSNIRISTKIEMFVVLYLLLTFKLYVLYIDDYTIICI